MEQSFINKEIKGSNNLEKLKKLFPNAIKDGQVDFEELKNELGQFEEVTEEKYEFKWIGKNQAKQDAQSGISGMTLKYYPEEGKDINKTENLYIEGDNLKILKLLRNNYANAIKMIYIDPPYNTGTDSFVYPDSFKTNTQEAEEQLGITTNNERNINIKKDNWYKNTRDSSRYHSAWISMMYSRIKVAWELLKEDGVIFISIDDNEQDNLKKICNEIFGEDNFVATIIWQKKFSPQNDATYFSNMHDFILCYAKNKKKDKNDFGWNRILLKRNDMPNGYSNPDNDPRGPWSSGDFTAEGPTENCIYEIVAPNGKKHMPPEGKRWVYNYENFKRLYEEKRFWFGKDGNAFPRIKRYWSEVQQGLVPNSIWFFEDVGHTQEGKQETNKLFERAVFDYPKPVRLLKRILEISTTDDDLVLDFFSGSASLAHAVMQLNAEDGCRRKYIMVQIPEECDEKTEAFKAGYKNICEIGKERIRRAGEKIKEETNADIDYGFKVFKLDETNINWEKEEFRKNIDSYLLSTTETEKEQLLQDFVEGSNDIDIVYELLLRYYGMPLSAKINKIERIGKRTYSIEDIIIVCLEDIITDEIIDRLASIDFSKLYLRDSSFKGENSLELKENLMIRLNLQKEYNNEKSYRVEFI